MKEAKTEDWPWGESTREEFEESIAGLAERWSRPPQSLKILLPSRGDDPRPLAWYAKVRVQSASPAAAEAFLPSRMLATSSCRVPTM